MTARRIVHVTTVFALAIALFAVAGVSLGDRSSQSSTVAVQGQPANGTPNGIGQLQMRLRSVPSDYVAWASLGLDYVQQARVTVDPSYYPKADGALHRSLVLNNTDNYVAMIGLGALAAARHDFHGAERWARSALAIDPDSAAAYGVLGDALIELGRYDDAFRAIQRMNDLSPDTGSLARASYAWELRGNMSLAQANLVRALQDADTPADMAFARYYLGELAFNSGHLPQAAEQYAAGLRADPTYAPLLEGRAKVEAARRQYSAAIRDYTALVNRVPQPAYVIELGELYDATSQHAAAQQQYALVRTEEQLFRANGVNVDLELALFEADHGSTRAALTAARTEWSRRQSILVADALAWALHRGGRDRDALHYENLAMRLGMRNALFWFHRGVIERALGRRGASDNDLRTALRIDPYFSPLRAAEAQVLLRSA